MISAGSRSDGLLVVEREPLALVITDLRLPDGDGLDLVRATRRLPDTDAVDRGDGLRLRGEQDGRAGGGRFGLSRQAFCRSLVHFARRENAGLRNQP